MEAGFFAALSSDGLRLNREGGWILPVILSAAKNLG